MAAQGGYWPSYNVPYNKRVYVATGFQKAYETYGDAYSYQNCSRALIFARDFGSIQTLDALKTELRLNQYQTDPISAGNPAAAVCARYDLRTTSAKTYGGTDSKATSFSSMTGAAGGKQGRSSAQCGPTHDDQAPFQWSTSTFANQVHLGQPDLFNFGFVEIDFYLH